MTATLAQRVLTTHGRSKGDSLYLLWKRVKKRCHSPTAHNWKWYGGRGICLYGPWRENPVAFMEYIETHLGPRPEGMSLDRIDPDGDYRPGNLRWATWYQQRHNRSQQEAA